MTLLRAVSVAAAVAASSFALPKVATIDIGRLARTSEVVVVGTVTHVGSVGGVQVAFVDRADFIKGFVFERIAFVAEPTWTCDTSKAVVGERVLLYLEQIPNTLLASGGFDLVSAKKACARTGAALYTLGHSGRGRIPLVQRGQQWFARVRLSSDYPPELNINLTLPRSAPVVRQNEKAGLISVRYFRQLSGSAIRGGLRK